MSTAFLIGKSIEQLMFPKYTAVLQSASRVRGQELIACFLLQSAVLLLLFLHCEFAFAAPGVVTASTIVTVWLTDSGLRPNRAGSVLLHQFEEGLSNQSLLFLWDGTFRSPYHVLISRYVRRLAFLLVSE